MHTRKFPRLAFVDLETTGGAATEDRITEVGVIEVDEDGVREWSSLVNPEMPIPPFIQSLTGITNDMVRDAPTFEQIADDLAKRLSDRLFIAHNARFDYSFLKQAFRRSGRDFRPPVLCTVRLSRKLFPGFERHNLDTLAERHQLVVTQRHRALGDAQLIWQFWQNALREHGEDLLDDTVGKLLSKPAMPSRLDMLPVDALPTTHGVYLCRGQNDVPLYVGRADNLRRRVMAHLGSERLSLREQHLVQQIERIDWIETAGEIGALLQEAALIQQLKPEYNQHTRGLQQVFSWRLVQQDGGLQAELATPDNPLFGRDPRLYGLYTSPRKAGDALKSIADAHQLCHALLGLEKCRPGKGCFASQVGKCRGACIGRESVAAHDARVLAALSRLKLQPWPYDGAIGIRESEMLHVIDGWAYLGSARTPEETAALLQKDRPAFDKTVYQILHKRLSDLEDQIVKLENVCMQ